MATLTGHIQSISSILILPGKIITGSKDSTLYVWDSETYMCKKFLRGHTEGIGCVDALLNGTIISISEKNDLRVWDTSNERGFIDPNDAKRYMCILPNGKVVTTSSKFTLKIFYFCKIFAK